MRQTIRILLSIIRPSKSSRYKFVSSCVHGIQRITKYNTEKCSGTSLIRKHFSASGNVMRSKIISCKKIAETRQSNVVQINSIFPYSVFSDVFTMSIIIFSEKNLKLNLVKTRTYFS